MSRTLAIDIGGTGLKASVLDAKGRMMVDRVRIATPHPSPPRVLVDALAALVALLPRYDRVGVGFPGVIRGTKVLTAPHLGNEQWRGFDLGGALAKRLGKPVRLINDAEMQGLAAVRGVGLELAVTLGTGVGTALFRDGRIMPHLELSQHPVHDGKTYDEYLGDAALKKVGRARWNRRVRHVIGILHTLLNYDRLYIGGGNSRHVTLPRSMRATLVSNQDGLLGAHALWKLRPRRSSATGSLG